MKTMNLKFLTVAFALIAFTLAGTSCESGEKEGDQQSQDHEHMENGDHSHEDEEADHTHSEKEEHGHEGDHEMNWTISTEDGKAIATGYLNIKNALVNTDQAKATAAANSLLDATDGMEGGATLENFRAHVQEVTNAENVAGQRKGFEHLSEHVYLLAKNNDLGITVHKQYCPMAFDSKGAYWLSAEEEIMNPYFGDKMLHCGETQETIAAK